MIFCTYPANKQKVTALIPILIAELLNSINNNFGTYLIDRLSYIKDDIGFDLENYVKTNNLDINLERLAVSNIKSEILKEYADLETTNDEWLVCACGKVEVINYKEHKKLDLVSANGLCIICGSSVELKKMKGVIYMFNASHILTQELISKINKSVFPNNYAKQIIDSIKDLDGQRILLTRQRKTGYTITHKKVIWNLDPSFYNVFVSWEHLTKVVNPCLVSGPSGIFSYIIGLIFSKTLINHVFIPRYNIEHLENIAHVDFGLLKILLASSLSWKENRVVVNWADLKYIEKNQEEIRKKIAGFDIINLEDVSAINRNILSL